MFHYLTSLLVLTFIARPAPAYPLMSNDNLVNSQESLVRRMDYPRPEPCVPCDNISEHLVLPNNFTRLSTQFKAIPVQKTIAQCAHAGGYAWLPLADVPLEPHFLRVWGTMPPPKGVVMDMEGLCVKKFEPVPSVNIVEEAATQFTFKERPTLQTFSECAKEGFAWWPIFEHNIAGQEPHFFRVQKGASAPQNVGATMGRCVDYAPPHPQFGEVHPCWAEFSISRTELYKSSTTTLERCAQIGKAFRLSHLSEKCGIVWPGMLLTVSQAEMKGMCYVGPYDPRYVFASAFLSRKLW
jgi:hypothetical protein